MTDPSLLASHATRTLLDVTNIFYDKQKHYVGKSPNLSGINGVVNDRGGSEAINELSVVRMNMNCCVPSEKFFGIYSRTSLARNLVRSSFVIRPEEMWAKQLA